jgi:2-keto-4-pentenoate hydratase
MTEANEADAAAMIWDAWCAGRKLDSLPPPLRPKDRAHAYAAQAGLPRASGQLVVGWKIAATSAAGQKHINVAGPLAGRLLETRVLPDGMAGPLANNVMMVAEAEFAFRMGRDLPKRDRPYTVDEVLAAVATLHPTIEVPDSRFRDFTAVGAEQLIVDAACAGWFFVGDAAPDRWRDIDLAAHATTVYKNGRPVAQGTGANVLGDPRLALTWLANEVAAFAGGLRNGDIVSTGTCVVPVPVRPADQLIADFGELGRVHARLV